MFDDLCHQTLQKLGKSAIRDLRTHRSRETLRVRVRHATMRARRFLTHSVAFKRRQFGDMRHRVARDKKVRHAIGGIVNQTQQRHHAHHCRGVKQRRSTFVACGDSTRLQLRNDVGDFAVGAREHTNGTRRIRRMNPRGNLRSANCGGQFVGDRCGVGIDARITVN